MEARIHHPRSDSDEQPRFLHISWLYAQDYCEYQLYLDQVKGVTVDDTPATLTVVALTMAPLGMCKRAGSLVAGGGVR